MNASRPSGPEPTDLNRLLGASDEDLAKLFDALAQHLATNEATELERDATARRDMADVLEAEQRLQREQAAEARHEVERFRAALSDAFARSGGDEHREVPYDDRFPEQSAAADLLIRYLLRTGFAEVATEEASDGQYVYRLRVFWSRLRQLAAQRGVQLAPPPSPDAS